MIKNKYDIQKNTERNYNILSQIIFVFFKHHKEIDTELHKTFWHEFGHIYNALTNNFEFTALIIKDTKKKHFHLFHLNPEDTNEILFSQSPISLYDKFKTKNSKGIALYYNPNPDAIESIALGGFMNDFKMADKSVEEMLTSFGINRFTLKAKKGSDFNYIEKSINFQFMQVYDYLYFNHINKRNSRRFRGYPLKKFKYLIFLKSSL